MIKAVIFDFDGLIVDTETTWFHCYKDVLEQQGIRFDIEMFGKVIGTSKTVSSLLAEQTLSQDIDISKIQMLASKRFHEVIAGIDTRDGVREYLAEALNLDLKIGLASSSTYEWVSQFLDKFGILNYFQVIKTRDDVEKVKPHPDVYLQAIQGLGSLPEEALAFEDSPVGARAAIAAGLRCVVFPNFVTSRLLFQEYDALYESMSAQTLQSVLERVNLIG